MEVSLSTGFPTTGYATGEVYLMLTERSRYEDKCSAETLGNIISRSLLRCMHFAEPSNDTSITLDIICVPHNS